MMSSRQMFRNHKIFKNIRSKTRQLDMSPDMAYIIVYAFLYKYCSDVQKDYFLSLIENDEITLDEAFKKAEYHEKFKSSALETFGYFIPASNLFIDDLINQRYSERFFIHDFIEEFSKRIEFEPNSNYETYFNFIFDSLRSEINLNKFEFEGDSHLIVKDLIYSISKLDVLDEQFSFEKVFNAICDSRLIQIDRDPDYINNIFTRIVASQKSGQLIDVYNPILNDATSIIDLSDYINLTIGQAYGKGFDRITYCAGIVKLLIHYFDLNRVHLEFGSPFESVDMDGAEFDVVISKIPSITPNRVKRLNPTHNKEIIKRSRRKKLEDAISETFNIPQESLENNLEFKNTVEELLAKMEFENDMQNDFVGEYEVLKDSEYLFLINLINSLKKDGIMVVSLAQGFLFKNSLKTLRKYLTVERNYIDCIISLPDELTRKRGSDVIVIFKKDKLTDDIVFIDLSKDSSGLEPVRSMSRATFRRNLMVNRKSLAKLIEVYDRRQVIERFSNVVNVRELSKNEYNLAISRYVDTFEGEFIQLEDLKNQKKEITSKIKELNEKIDMMMDELNIQF